MFRRHLTEIIPGENGFRWRGAEITRLEGFSDAVFAFAVTLLVVSLEVPKGFRELIETMRGFGPFAICFAILANIWFQHTRFFRRYGLQTSWATFLNCVLLFFVLFYVYPLKFLFRLILEGSLLNIDDVRRLFVIYGAGYTAVFFVLALLYLHAWRLRERLGLDPSERVKTFRSLIDHVAMSIIGLTSVGLALSLPARLIGVAGYFYFAIPIYFTIVGRILQKRERALIASGN